MLRRATHFVVALAAIGTIATSPTSLAAQQQDHDSEHRFRFDVVGGGPPGVWSFRTGGFLGILMVDLTPELRVHFGVTESAGVMISSISDDSPAAEAGLRVGDIITSIDGEAVADSRELVRAVASKQGGDSANLEVFRDGSYTTLTATLAERERTQFWLNTLGESGAGHLQVLGQDGENVFVLPGPDSADLHLRREAVDEVMENLHERLASPDFQGRMMDLRSNTRELEQRIRELEERLEQLTRKLQELDS